MKVVVEDAQSAIDNLNKAARILAAPLGFASFSAGNIFSQVSGLDQSGLMHGTIRSDSEPEATKGLAQHFNNVVDLLTAQLVGYQMADTHFAEVLYRVGNTVREDSYRAVIDDVETAHPVVNAFDATNPVAGRPLSLDGLNMDLMATDIASMSGMSLDWVDTASTIGEALSFIPPAIADLQGSAETESIARAIQHLGQIETAGSKYMANAGALAAHTGSLVTVTEANALQAAAALAVVRATPNPGVAKALEEAFLAGFSPKLTTELVPVTPLFTQLLPELEAPNGAGTDQSGALAPAAPTFENAPLPKVIQQALSNAGYRDLAYATTPSQVVEQFGRPNPDMLQSIAAGATPTQAASAAAPSMPPALHGLPGAALPGGGTAAAASPMGGTGIGQLTGGNPGTALAGAGNGGAGAPLSTGGPNVMGAAPVGTMGTGSRGTVGTAGSPIGNRGSLGAVGNGRTGGVGFGGGRAVGFEGSRSGARLTGALGAGGGAAGALGSGGGVAGPVGGFGGGTGTGLGPGSPGQAGNTFVSGGQAGASQTGARGAVAGGPGMYGAGQKSAGKQKRGKVHAVTSAVEREGNLKALLGEAPEVVPGVIGAWVRQPRT